MLSTLRVVYSLPNKSCLKRVGGKKKHKETWGLDFSHAGSSLTRFQIQCSHEPDLKSFGQWITSQKFGERPGPGELVTESQSGAAPSHESHFQLGTDCEFLPSEWCFRWLGAGLSVSSHQRGRRKSGRAEALQHPARDPQPHKTRTF